MGKRSYVQLHLPVMPMVEFIENKAYYKITTFVLEEDKILIRASNQSILYGKIL